MEDEFVQVTVNMPKAVRHVCERRAREERRSLSNMLLRLIEAGVAAQAGDGPAASAGAR